MTLRSYLSLSYLLITLICFGSLVFYLYAIFGTPNLLHVQQPLEVQANLLAHAFAPQVHDNQLDADTLYNMFDKDATVIHIPRDGSPIEGVSSLYMTDADGIVIFNSAARTEVEQRRDYSAYEDVADALQGRYGLRKKALTPDAQRHEVMVYVSAPLQVEGKIIGTLSLGQTTTIPNTMLNTIQERMLAVALLAFLVAFLFNLGFGTWLKIQIERLTRFADQVRAGERVPVPISPVRELKQMGVAFQEMRKALEEKHSLQELAHEVQSPLSAIQSAVENLKNPKHLPEHRSGALENIRNSAVRIDELVKRMLKLAALESGNDVMQTTQVALDDIVRTVVTRAAPILEEKHLQVDLRVKTTVPIMGDPDKLTIAIENLLTNAVDFSPETGRIVITCAQHEHRMDVTIDDEGEGMPDYAKSKIFDAFFSVPRPDSKKKGNGLGLNLVQTIATAHNGTIELENLPTRGCRAVFSLPIA